jgi:hypothetical protein
MFKKNIILVLKKLKKLAVKDFFEWPAWGHWLLNGVIFMMVCMLCMTVDAYYVLRHTHLAQQHLKHIQHTWLTEQTHVLQINDYQQAIQWMQRLIPPLLSVKHLSDQLSKLVSACAKHGVQVKDVQMLAISPNLSSKLRLDPALTIVPIRLVWIGTEQQLLSCFYNVLQHTVWMTIQTMEFNLLPNGMVSMTFIVNSLWLAT